MSEISEREKVAASARFCTGPLGSRVSVAVAAVPRPASSLWSLLVGAQSPRRRRDARDPDHYN